MWFKRKPVKKLSIAFVEAGDLDKEIWEVLQTMRYRVDVFKSADEFLKAYCRGTYRLVVFDWDVPYNGVNLVKFFIENNPDQTFIVSSGSVDDRLKQLKVILDRDGFMAHDNKEVAIEKLCQQAEQDHVEMILQMSLLEMNFSKT